MSKSQDKPKRDKKKPKTKPAKPPKSGTYMLVDVYDDGKHEVDKKHFRKVQFT